MYRDSETEGQVAKGLSRDSGLEASQSEYRGHQSEYRGHPETSRDCREMLEISDSRSAARENHPGKAENPDKAEDREFRWVVRVASQELFVVH